MTIAGILASTALAGQTAPPSICPDGEEVRAITKVRVCERPFKLWARDLQVSVKARTQALDVGGAVALKTRELSDTVSKALRTQGSALCVGMMSTPCTMKNAYAEIVAAMPGLLIDVERARSSADLDQVLERADDLATRELPAAGGACLVTNEMFVLDGDTQRRTQAVPGGVWTIDVHADGGGVSGEGVVLSWRDMSCSKSGGQNLVDAHTSPGHTHSLRCEVGTAGESLWIVNPQGGLLDGAPGRAEVRLSVCASK